MDVRFSGRRFCALVPIMLAITAGAPAAQAQPIETIVQDDALMLHGGSEEQIRTGMQRARSLGIDRVRLTAGWSTIAPHPDLPTPPSFDATDPAEYPAGNWFNLDRAVRLAHEEGLAPMIDIAFWAPRWGTREPLEVNDRMATEIDPRMFADFAKAVALRYSGTWAPPVTEKPEAAPPQPSPDRNILDALFGKPQPAPQPQPTQSKPAAPAPLPAVDTFTVWNEPNHPGFLRPQWVRVDGKWHPRSADIYRAMVRASYPAIKAVAPQSRVLIGGTASMGSSTPGVSGVPPLRFLRALACVDEELRPVTTGECAGFERLPGDGWAHHPYSLRTTPDVDTKDQDKLPVAATVRLAATLRELANSGRVSRAVASIYMTEYGYETSNPDPNAPFSLEDQGRLLAWAEHIATSVPAVRSWPQFQLYDRPNEAPRPGMRAFGDWHSGLYFNSGEPKPAAATYATPAFAGCVGRGRWVQVWGRMRGRNQSATGQVEVRASSGRWAPAPTFDRPARSAKLARASVSASDGDAVSRFTPYVPGAAYRLRWTVSGQERSSPAVAPAAKACRAQRGGPRSRKARRARR